jgi:hypothetical protein
MWPGIRAFNYPGKEGILSPAGLAKNGVVGRPVAAVGHSPTYIELSSLPSAKLKQAGSYQAPRRTAPRN